MPEGKLTAAKVGFECVIPILRVNNLPASIRLLRGCARLQGGLGRRE